MRFLIWFAICLCQVFLIRQDFTRAIVLWSEKFHSLILDFINQSPSEFNWFYKAILFGEDLGLKQKPEIKVFVTLGIYHLIVVSGSHLTFIESFLNKMLCFFPNTVKYSVTFIFLTVFTAANRWQPACLRSYLHWMLKNIFQYKKPLSIDIQTSVVILCLLLKPDLAYSLSFQLSCAATLGLSVVENLNTKSKNLIPAFACVLLTSPLLFSIQPCISWLVLPANTFLLSGLQTCLFPLAFLNFILPFIKSFTEPLLKNLFSFLSSLSFYHQPELCFWTERSSLWGMYYVGLLFFTWRLALPLLLRREFRKNQMIS